MNRSMLATATLLLSFTTSPAQAGDIRIRAPGVAIDIGPSGIFIDTPGYRMQLPGRGRPAAPAKSVPKRKMPRAETSFRYEPGGAPPPVPLPAPRPVDQPPAPLVDDESGGAEPLTVAPDEQRPPTPVEFAAGFEPTAGRHEVKLTHPTTRRPVTVRFTLPAGQPRDVRIRREQIEFDYGRSVVTLKFLASGKVRVETKN